MSYAYRVRQPSRAGRNLRLWVTASGLAMGAAFTLPQAASAGTYTAGTEDQLRAAITAANGDADPSATITLTGNIAVTDPSLMPAASKAITIDTAGFNLTGETLNNSTGTALGVIGGGQVQLSGASTLNADFTVSSAALQLSGGATLTVPGGSTTHLSGVSNVVVDGAGSVLTTGLINIGEAASSVSSVTVQNGGLLHVSSPTATSYVGLGANSHGTLTVTGPGSQLIVDGTLGVGIANNTGAGEIIVSNGATATIGTLSVGQNGTAVPSTPAHLLVQDPGTTLIARVRLFFAKGTIDVLNGAKVTTPQMQLGFGGAATLNISGAGSSVTVTNGNLLLGDILTTTSTATISDGGALEADAGITAGGAAAGRVGVINIGAAAGSPAAAAGAIDTTGLVLTAGLGTLNFNHTDADYQFSAPISGGGAINQLAGVTHLTGDSSAFAGVTTVSGGELHVDGTLGSAASSVAVTGGLLGGSGIIGGNVSVASGAVLAPGSNGPGTLTIDGALTTAAGSTFNVEFGRSNVVGGPLNDLVKVDGDATLAGTLNVSVSPGGAFDEGLYRVVSYGGALTDNGLTLGATPPGSTVTLQTAITGQVNLVNTGGLSVNFWDGDGVGHANNSVVDGGPGTWTAASTNWTVETGAANAAYTPDSFVIFAAAPGAVTIDDAAAGPVHVSGLQFAVDSYSLNGDALTLTGPAATIRVGDGTADGASYVATINAPLAGSAKLVKTDLGTLVLTGNNTYTGGTEVAAGRLLINGTQAGGAVQVDAAGTLGGTGVSGGPVTVAGTLAPGGLTVPGTLTVQGDVAFASTAQLSYRLGQAGVAGGALNDLLVVDGDLTLAGTLNVVQSAGGAFGPGVYRLIDYTGSLTDNGLNVSTLPGGWAGAIQTAVAGQVNLVAVQPPLTFTYWDGGDGVDNGVISGGSGVWRATTANWTTATGALDGAFTAGGFAVFAAAAGAVTVDGSQGAIHVSGMQFAANGYQLVGDAVTLDAGQDIVRVGDGTSAGASFVATIGAALTGPGQLDKTDAGTLVLTGANTYTGGTLISGGTLQLGDGGASGSIAGDVVNNGVLAFNRADSASFTGVISGGGTILQIGSGTTTLTADSSAFTGQTQVRSGTLAVDGALGGGVQVLPGGRLTGTGVVGALINQGMVAPGHGIGTLTVAGDYAGQGGALEMDVQLGGDASPADRLVVRGATSGTTPIDVQRVGGGGAVTSNGILLVQVDGASDGVFTLKGDFKLHGEDAVVGGAYAYVLRKDASGDWLLRSSVNDPPGGPVSARPVTLYQPGSPVYEAFPQALLALDGLGTMRERVDGRQWSGDAEGDGVWGRLEGGHTHLEPTTSTTQADLDIDRWTLQFGVDHALAQDVAGGRLVGGLTAHYGEAYADVSSPSGNGGVDAKGYGVGATLTWTTKTGAYVDAQTQASAFDSDLNSRVLGKRAGGVKGYGYAASIETGQSFAAGVVSVTPQVQLTYSKVAFDSFTDPFGARVSPDEGDSLVGRLALALDHDWAATGKGVAGRVYGLVNLKHEFLDSARVDVSGVELSNRAARTWGGLAAGGTYAWRGGRFAVYGEVSADTTLSGFGDSYDVAGTAGLRMRF